MANGCVNQNLDTTNYSSPIPVIGLYIAAGSSVCMLFMLFDIVYALRRREPWIPCRLFSLNSVTLTLFSIASKIQVDLTTTMPGVQDQLSKLTGSILLCISMGFLSPSVASNPEYVSNMVALSILIITVVVNICIQLVTGVIHLFIAEHIIIMCCMLVLLLLLWYCASDFKVFNEFALAANRSRFMDKINSSKCMSQRLKLSYIQGFINNPQLRTCMNQNNFTAAGFCLISFCVLIQAIVRSLILKQLKVCEGTSDYTWSVWMILVVQILTITVGCFAITYRWFKLFSRSYFRVEEMDYEEETTNKYIRTNPMFGARPWHKFLIHLNYYASFFILLTRMLILMPTVTVYKALGGRMMKEEMEEDSASVIVFKNENPSDDDFDYVDRWRMQKAVQDLNKWIKVSSREPPSYLLQLLSRTNPSQEFRNLPEKIDVCSLSMALLVRIATFCVPCDRTKSLSKCFDEASEIITFIESKNPAERYKYEFNGKLTKALLIGKVLDIHLPEIIKKSSHRDNFHSLPQLERSFVILEGLKDITDGYLYENIAAVISAQECQTVEGLCSNIEQLFVDMFHLLLAELPNSIFIDVSESPTEELKKKVRQSLKFLLLVESFEDKVQWSFPTEFGISSLIITPQPEVPATQ